MSLKFRNQNGVETPIAGLNGTSGELVPSVALMKSGVANVSMPNTSSLDQLFTVQVTFDTPFEDENYVLNVDQCEVSEAEINRVFDRTASGFYIAVMYNRQRTAVPSYNVTARITWQAFKLMTDEDRALDEQAIADLQAVVPSTATSSNQLVPANGCVLYKTVSSISDIRALAKNRSYFVVTTASITLQDDVGVSYEIPAGSVSTPFHWNGGDTHINFCFNYPVASAHIWAVFLNSNGQNRAKRIV